MKKQLLLLALAASSALNLHAATAPANVITDEKTAPFVVIVAADATSISYRLATEPPSVPPRKLEKAAVKGIVFSEPKEFSIALELYESGDLEKAIEGFKKVSADTKDIKSIKGNYGSLSDFYICESYRQLNDFEKLKTASRLVDANVLENKYHKEQLKIYDIWSGIPAKAWPRIVSSVTEFKTENLKEEQLAQLAYLNGMALENQGENAKALDSYSKVLTVDLLRNQVLAADAIRRSISILEKDEELKAAKAAVDAKQEPKALGLIKLQQAAALVKNYQNGLKDPAALPAELLAFEQYAHQPKAEAAATE